MVTNSVNENEELQLIDKNKKKEVSKQSQGVCLLFLSAFLFSFMGMFLQFTGRMGKMIEVLMFFEHNIIDVCLSHQCSTSHLRHTINRISFYPISIPRNICSHLYVHF